MRIAEMNRMIAEYPIVAKEVYVVMDAEFERNMMQLEGKMK